MRDLVPFELFKKCEKDPLRSITFIKEPTTLVKVTLLQGYFHVFKIVQMVPNHVKHHICFFVFCLLAQCKMDHLDAVFAIDLSAQADLVLNNQKGLLKRLVNQVQRSSDLNNVGLISYTSSAKVEIPLSQNRYDFNALVDSLQKKNGYRAIDRAILTAHERIFLPKHKELNAKPTFNQKLPKKLFVLFTSGGHVDNVNSVLPEDAARLLYDLDVEILVVAFNSTNEDVINIVRGNKENFYTYRDGGVLGIWNYICDTFGTSEF